MLGLLGSASWENGVLATDVRHYPPPAERPKDRARRRLGYRPRMADLTVLHNPQCSTSKQALETVAAAGVEADVVQYLKTPLDRTELLELIDELEDPPADLVRKDPFFKELGLDPADYTTPEAVADLLVEHPRLMQRPVLVRNGRAIIGRPKDRVAPFVAGP
jgi:arsenate reductase